MTGPRRLSVVRSALALGALIALGLVAAPAARSQSTAPLANVPSFTQQRSFFETGTAELVVGVAAYLPADDRAAQLVTVSAEGRVRLFGRTGSSPFSFQQQAERLVLPVGQDQTAVGVVFAELDGDPLPEIGVGVYGGPERLLQIEGEAGSFTLGAPQSFGPADDRTTSIVSGKIDEADAAGNNFDDLVVGDEERPIQIYYNLPPAGLRSATAVELQPNNAPPPPTVDLALADVDGNEGLDLVAAYRDTASYVYFNTGGTVTANSAQQLDTSSLPVVAVAASASGADGGERGLIALGTAASTVQGTLNPPKLFYFSVERGADAAVGTVAAGQTVDLSLSDAINVLKVGNFNSADNALDVLVARKGRELGLALRTLKDGVPSKLETPSASVNLRADIRDLAVGYFDKDNLNDAIAVGSGQIDLFQDPATPFGSDCEKLGENADSSSVSIGLLFCRSILPARIEQPGAAAAGDLDGDGDYDLVVARAYGSANVYRNTTRDPESPSPANFAREQLFRHPQSDQARNVVGLVVADMNNDRLPDVVAEWQGAGGGVFLQNAATPTLDFLPATPFPPIPEDTHLAVADMDGNGVLDIVVANNDWGGRILRNTIDSAGNIALGTLPRLNFGAPNITAMALGDFDRNSRVDILLGYDQLAPTPQTSPPSPYPTALVLFNDGTLDFQRGVVTKEQCAEDTKDNVRLDGKFDCLAGRPGRVTAITIGDMAGKGVLGATVAVDDNDGFNSAGLDVADFDGDGRLDVLGWGTTSAVFFNDLVTAPNTIPPTQRNCRDAPAGRMVCISTREALQLTPADFDGDGDADVIGIYNDDPRLVLYFNSGSGLLGVPQPEEFPTSPGDTSYPQLAQNSFYIQTAIGDLNNDRLNDLLVVDGGGAIFVGAGPLKLAAALPLVKQGDLKLLSPTGIATGDLDDDGDLDAAVVGIDGTAALAFNDGDAQFAAVPLGNPRSSSFFDVAVGDIDDDELPDVLLPVLGGQSLAFLNDPLAPGRFYTGTLTLTEGKLDCLLLPPNVRCVGGDTDAINSFAVADIDGDGINDVIAGRGGKQGVVYFGDGLGTLPTTSASCAPPPPGVGCFGSARSAFPLVAAGDLNGDRRSDIVVGNYGGPGQVFLSQDNGGFAEAPRGADCFAPPPGVSCFGDEGVRMNRLVLADYDGDRDLDIATGYDPPASDAVFLNDGTGRFSALRARSLRPDQALTTWGLAVGDLDGDGDADLVSAGASRGPLRVQYTGDVVVPGIAALRVYPNPGVRNTSADAALKVSLTAPAPPCIGRPERQTFGSDCFLSGTLTATLTLADPTGAPVAKSDLRAFYSLGGGGQFIATTVDITPTSSPPNLPGWSVQSPLATNCPGGCRYLVTWNAARAFIGQSDHVVLRVEVASRGRQVSGAPLPPPLLAAWTEPLRVRGTQLRVLLPNTPAGTPRADLPRRIFLPAIGLDTANVTMSASPRGAVLYRFSQGQGQGRPLLGTGNRPITTNAAGFLRGSQVLTNTALLSDTFLAAWPYARHVESDGTTVRSRFRVFYTNAAPENDERYRDGEVARLTGSGVQTVAVSPNRPLVLFDFVVSLEWDVKAGDEYLERLRGDLVRTSELLFDWTEGQAALGNVQIFDAKERWDTADIRIYASNRVRPNSSIGGLRQDGGEVRIGPNWNRYGDLNGNLGDDWARALAHEIGHYAFGLNDNYLGEEKDGVLTQTATCSGVMTDPYVEAPPEQLGELRTRGDDWKLECGSTLSQLTLARSDWEIVVKNMPWMREPTDMYGKLLTYQSLIRGPQLLLDVTRVEVARSVDDSTDADLLSSPIVSSSAGDVDGGTAYLFKGDSSGKFADVIELGQPVQGQVVARGATGRDRVCIFDLNYISVRYDSTAQRDVAAPAPRFGCLDLDEGGGRRVQVNTYPDWRPEIVVEPQGTGSQRAVRVIVRPSSPTSCRALTVAVFGYSSNTRKVGEQEGLESRPEGCVASFENAPAEAGLVYVRQVGDLSREAVTTFGLGGSPVGFSRRGGRTNAPVLSPDGQVIVYGRTLDFATGRYYTFQVTSRTPEPPSWATPVGQAYRLSASADTPPLNSTSISFSYLGRQVPPGEDNPASVRIYYYPENAACPPENRAPCWQMLPSKVNTALNVVSAAMPGPGVYSLMSSLYVPLPNQGWNSFGYTSRLELPVEEALSFIAGKYELVQFYDPASKDGWLFYDPDQPALRTLRTLKPGKGYLIYMKDAGQALLLRGGPLDRPPAPNTPPPAPPSSVYLALEPGLAEPGAAVTALVGDSVCGRGRVVNGTAGLAAVVAVVADGPGAAGCGAAGREIAFVVGGRHLDGVAVWDNSRLQALELRAPARR